MEGKQREIVCIDDKENNHNSSEMFHHEEAFNVKEEVNEKNKYVSQEAISSVKVEKAHENNEKDAETIICSICIHDQGKFYHSHFIKSTITVFSFVLSIFHRILTSM